VSHGFNWLKDNTPDALQKGFKGMTDDIRNKEFLGQGLAFPLQINSRGGIALAKGENDIEQAIRIVLQTTPGERVMRPEFGCRLQEMVFAPRNVETINLIVTYVGEALDRWEPRIEVQNIEVFDDTHSDGALLIKIDYVISSTYDERSIVYPFYLAGEE
jgi:phage baseplate assembly protein W